MGTRRMQNLFEALGLPRLPRTARIYLVLVFTFAGLALISSLPFFSVQLGLVSVEGLKTVLAAFLGIPSQRGESWRLRDSGIRGG